MGQTDSAAPVELQGVPTDHRILLAVQRQVAGLVAEKAGLQAQIDGLVAERDELRKRGERHCDLLRSFYLRMNRMLLNPAEVNYGGHLVMMSTEIEALLERDAETLIGRQEPVKELAHHGD